jgi:hypothetical protein
MKTFTGLGGGGGGAAYTLFPIDTCSDHVVVL